jgi:hypothetical protein
MIMVTKSQRKLGRTIRILKGSVELSAKESQAKEAEKKFRENARIPSENAKDSPIQSLRKPQADTTERSKP